MSTYTGTTFNPEIGGTTFPGSDKIDSTHSTINSNSGNWDSTHTTVNSNSASWDPSSHNRGTVLFTTLSGVGTGESAAVLSGGHLTGIINSNAVNMCWTGRADVSAAITAKFKIPVRHGEETFIGRYVLAYAVDRFNNNFYSIKSGVLAVDSGGVDDLAYHDVQKSQAGAWSFALDSSNDYVIITKAAGSETAQQDGKFFIKIDGGAGFETDLIYKVQ